MPPKLSRRSFQLGRVGLLNRGCVIAPFHNMMLICPATSRAQVDQLVGAFGEVVAVLAG